MLSPGTVLPVRSHALRLVLLSLLLVGCGGGGDSPPVTPTTPTTPTTPVTPVTPTPVATAMVLQSGDAQTASAGSTVLVAPAVVIRDQSAQPMSGVTVTFVVDSGGGSVTRASAVTGADGVASSGEWRLGFGRNRLRAVSGTLAPVPFTATASGELTVGQSDFTAGGGVLTVSRPGTPADSFQLTMPARAVSGSARINVLYGDSTGAPRKTGVRLISPVITLTSSETFSDSAGPVRIRVPVTLRPGEWPVAILFDKVTGAMEVLPTVPDGLTRVTTITRHLDATQLTTSGATARASAQSGAGRSGASRVGTFIQLVIGAVNYSDLEKDQITGYQPAVDDWEFDNMLSLPANHEKFGRKLVGLAITAAWYYDHFKAGRGNLNERFQQAPGVEYSNPRGIKLVAVAGAGFAKLAVDQYASALRDLADILKKQGITADSLTLLAVKSGMFVTGRPYLLIAEDLTETGMPNIAALLVYATRGNAMSVTLGTTASGVNAPRTITLANGTFGPVTFGITDAESGAVQTYTMPTLSPTGATAGFSAIELNDWWSQFFNNTIGNGVYPTANIATRDYRPAIDTLFLPDDTTRMWVECSPLCEYSYPVTGNFTPQGLVGGALLYGKNGANAPWRNLNLSTLGLGLKFSALNDGQTVGLALLVSPAPQSTQGRYFGWTQLVVKTKRLSITPNPLKFVAGLDFTLTAAYDRPTPSGASWVWEMGDGRTLTTTVNRITTKYALNAASKYDVKVSMKVGSKLEATGHDSATLIPPQFVWSLRTTTLQNSTLPQGGIGLLRSDTLVFNTVTRMLSNLLATPADNSLGLGGLATGVAGCDAAAVLMQFPAGQANDTLDGRYVFGIIGTCGDPDYSGNLTMGPLGNGTIVGSASAVPQPSVIVLPGGSINATMNGPNLTGTFVWNVRYSSGIGTYTVNFSAVQVRPQ